MTYGLSHLYRIQSTALVLVVATLLSVVSCRSSRTGEFEILGPVDETDEAAKLVQSANQDLQQIKLLYNKNEDKREEIKKALEANNADEVKKASNDVIDAINEGFDLMKSGESIRSVVIY